MWSIDKWIDCQLMRIECYIDPFNNKQLDGKLKKLLYEEFSSHPAWINLNGPIINEFWDRQYLF